MSVVVVALLRERDGHGLCVTPRQGPMFGARVELVMFPFVHDILDFVCSAVSPAVLWHPR